MCLKVANGLSYWLDLLLLALDAGNRRIASGTLTKEIMDCIQKIHLHPSLVEMNPARPQNKGTVQVSIFQRRTLTMDGWMDLKYATQKRKMD